MVLYTDIDVYKRQLQACFFSHWFWSSSDSSTYGWTCVTSLPCYCLYCKTHFSPNIQYYWPALQQYQLQQFLLVWGQLLEKPSPWSSVWRSVIWSPCIFDLNEGTEFSKTMFYPIELFVLNIHCIYTVFGIVFLKI